MRLFAGPTHEKTLDFYVPRLIRGIQGDLARFLDPANKSRDVGFERKLNLLNAILIFMRRPCVFLHAVLFKLQSSRHTMTCLLELLLNFCVK